MAEPFYQRASPSLLALTPADPPPRRPVPNENWNVLYQHLESRIAAFYTWRLSWWEAQGEIARYELPYRWHAFITANTFDRGLRKDNLIVDETATIAGRVCAAGMMSGLTDPDRPWVSLGPAMPNIEIDQAGQQWLDDTADALRYLQAHSNFYESLAVAYEDLVFFGNGVTIDYEHDANGLHCVNYCAGEYFLGVGFDFSDLVLYAEFRLTVGQIVERFGIEKCPDEIRRMWAQKGGALENEFIIGHAIEPNFPVRGPAGQEVGVVKGGFTWREIFWLRGKAGDGPLSEAGFREIPFSNMGWHRVSNDPYYRGPGSDALGATIQLQLETARQAELIEKIARPSMAFDIQLQNQPTSTRPDGITWVNTATGKPLAYPIYEPPAAAVAPITENLVQIRQRIETIFYNPLFRAIEMLRQEVRGNVTATEIDALKAEQLMQLGPVIGRVYEAIRGRIRRQLAIMHRAGWIKPVPESLRRTPLKIDFISMLTMAQRAAATAAITRAWAFAENVNPLAPTAHLNLDPDESVREMATLLGVPARIVRAPAMVKKLQAQMAQQAQQAQAAQLAMAGVGAAKGLSETQIAPNNALGALVGGGQQGGA